MAHGCKVDYRSFRQGTPEPARAPRVLLPPLRPLTVAEPVNESMSTDEAARME